MILGRDWDKLLLVFLLATLAVVLFIGWQRKRSQLILDWALPLAQLHDLRIIYRNGRLSVFLDGQVLSDFFFRYGEGRRALHLQIENDIYELSWQQRLWWVKPDNIILTQGNRRLIAYEHGTTRRYTRDNLESASFFISYSRNDFGLAKLLHQELTEAGHRPWLDRLDILHSEAWEYAIYEAIQAADFYLLLVSPWSLRSSAVRAEWEWAQDTPSRKLAVVLQSLDPQKPHFVPPGTPWVDVRNCPQNATECVLECAENSSHAYTTALPEQPRALHLFFDKIPMMARLTGLFHLLLGVYGGGIALALALVLLFVITTGVPVAGPLDGAQFLRLPLNARQDIVAQGIYHYSLVVLALPFYIAAFLFNWRGARVGFTLARRLVPSFSDDMIGLGGLSFLVVAIIFVSLVFSEESDGYMRAAFFKQIDRQLTLAEVLSLVEVNAVAPLGYFFTLLLSSSAVLWIAGGLLLARSKRARSWYPEYEGKIMVDERPAWYMCILQSLHKKPDELTITNTSTSTRKKPSKPVEIAPHTFKAISIFSGEADIGFAERLAEYLRVHEKQVYVNPDPDDLVARSETVVVLLISPWLLANSVLCDRIPSLLSKYVVVPVELQRAPDSPILSDLNRRNYIIVGYDARKGLEDILNTIDGRPDPERSPYSLDVPRREKVISSSHPARWLVILGIVSLLVRMMIAGMLNPLSLWGPHYFATLSTETTGYVITVMIVLTSILLICYLQIHALFLFGLRHLTLDGFLFFYGGGSIVSGLVFLCVSTDVPTVPGDSLGSTVAEVVGFLHYIWVTADLFLYLLAWIWLRRRWPQAARGIRRWVFGLHALTRQPPADTMLLTIGIIAVIVMIPVLTGHLSQSHKAIQKAIDMLHSPNPEQVQRGIYDLIFHGWYTDGSLHGADLSFTNLERAFLSGAHLQYADFDGANLRNSMLAGTELDHSDLRGADLTGAWLLLAELENVLLDETTILPDGTHWTPGRDLSIFVDNTRPDFWLSSDPLSPAHPDYWK